MSENTLEIILTLRQTLHARPAARLVRLAARFRARIVLRNLSSGAGPAEGRSLSQVLALGARQGQRLALNARGPDAEEALATLVVLLEEGENTAPPAMCVTGSAPATTASLLGLAAAPGVAIAPLRRWREADAALRTPVPTAHEAEHLRAALGAATAELAAGSAAARTRGEIALAEVLDAQQTWLADPLLVAAVAQRLDRGEVDAAKAWRGAVGEMVALFRAHPEAITRARAADLADVGQRVSRHLLGQEEATLALDEPVILVTDELPPSAWARLEMASVAGGGTLRVAGVCTSAGDALGHSAIVARARGVPMIVGLGEALHAVPEGTLVAMDGASGAVWVAPDAAMLDVVGARHALPLQNDVLPSLPLQHSPRLLANVTSLAEARLALASGAEGVGLVRSEYLFLGRAAPPDEREQAAFFCALAGALGERPLTIRLFDLGGDKGLPPYLGDVPTSLRGVALALVHPALLLTHLRALLRAVPTRPLWLLLPLVTRVEEVRAVQEALTAARAALQREEIPATESVELGAMIETPAAVAQIAALATAGVRFISLGSNDLARALGVGAYDPALWCLLREATRAARAVALGVELCGELASDPLALPALLELGLDALSVNPLAIPRLRQAGIRGWGSAVP